MNFFNLNGNYINLDNVTKFSFPDEMRPKGEPKDDINDVILEVKIIIHYLHNQSEEIWIEEDERKRLWEMISEIVTLL